MFIPFSPGVLALDDCSVLSIYPSVSPSVVDAWLVRSMRTGLAFQTCLVQVFPMHIRSVL